MWWEDGLLFKYHLIIASHCSHSFRSSVPDVLLIKKKKSNCTLSVSSCIYYCDDGILTEALEVEISEENTDKSFKWLKLRNTVPKSYDSNKLDFRYKFFTCFTTFTQLLSFSVWVCVRLLWKITRGKTLSSARIWKQIKCEVVVQCHDLNIIIYSMSLVKKTKNFHSIFG